MPRMKIKDLSPGLIVAKDVFSNDGKILIGKGIKLTPSYIERLQKFHIDTIFVIDEFSRFDVFETLAESTKIYANRAIRNLLRPNPIGKNSGDILLAVEAIIEEILQDRTILSLLLDVRTIEDHTFYHSVNVTILSLVVGISLGLSHNKLKILGAGALLHDVGKRSIPTQVLLKEGTLSSVEMDMIRNHVHESARILRSTPGIHPDMVDIAYQHHERFNGSGYPRGIAFDRVNELARIVAVSDVFDALTNERGYRKRHPPHEALEFLLGSGNFLFDADIVKRFVENIAIYRLGSICRLSTGQIGMITNVSKYISSRPIILVLYDSYNRRLEREKEIELDLGETKNATIHIVKIFD